MIYTFAMIGFIVMMAGMIVVLLPQEIIKSND